MNRVNVESVGGGGPDDWKCRADVVCVCVFAEVNSIKTNNMLISHERTGEMSQVASFHPWVSSDDNKMVREKWKLVKQQHCKLKFSTFLFSKAHRAELSRHFCFHSLSKESGNSENKHVAYDNNIERGKWREKSALNLSRMDRTTTSSASSMFFASFSFLL